MDLQMQITFIWIAVALLGILVTFRIFWAKEKATKKSEFIAPFLATLEKINRLVPDEYDTVTDILKADYPIHETAFITYGQNLTIIGRWFLRRKWLAYRGQYPEYPELPEEDFRYRFCHFIPTRNEDEPIKRDQVISALKRLIK